MAVFLIIQQYSFTVIEHSPALGCGKYRYYAENIHSSRKYKVQIPDQKCTSLYIFDLRVCDKHKLFKLKPPAIRGGGD